MVTRFGYVIDFTNDYNDKRLFLRLPAILAGTDHCG